MAGTFAAWRSRGALKRAWHDGDRFLDIVVIASVVIFMLLAAGVGVLALQYSVH